MGILVANVITVFLVSVAGQNGLSKAETLKLYQRVEQNLERQLDVDVRVTRFKRVRNLFKEEFTLSRRLALLRRWEGWFYRRDRNFSVLKIAVLPPIVEAGSFWLAGYATSCAYRRLNPVAYSNAENANKYGQPRFEHSVAGATHETAHLICAKHDDSGPNFMHSDVLRQVDLAPGGLTFFPKALTEISGYLERH